MSFALDALICAAGWTHVLLAPYTKVEESFNLHAVHDTLMYGVANLDKYDHFTFPGAVPRTFIGSVLLAWISNPVIHAANSFGLVSSKFDLQIIVRLVLSSLNAFGLCFLRRAISRRFGRPTSFLFTLITVSQFHLPFWMGRTLPNMFAMLPVNISSAFLLSRSPSSTKPSSTSVYTAIALLTFSAVVFRAELALLLAPLTLQALVSRHVSLSGTIQVGLVAGIFSIVLTGGVDSYFWKTLVWPEFSSIYFNVVEGKSSEWGTSPLWTYFSSFLPKLLLTALPLSIFGFAMDSRVREALYPHIGFIGIISLLGHKEWRFIIYSVPVFNLAAARTGRWMLSQRKSSLFGRLLFLGFCSSLVLNMLGTWMFTLSAMANYPGGEALKRFNDAYPPPPVGGKCILFFLCFWLRQIPDLDFCAPAHHVHISNLAAQTGASLFLQVHTPPFASTSLFSSASLTDQLSMYPWTVYDKTENLTLDELSASRDVTHLISEWSPFEMRSRMRIWRVAEVDSAGDTHANAGNRGVISGFAGWKVNERALQSAKGLRLGEFVGLIGENGTRGIVGIQEESLLWIYVRR
ncbi:hypothetical protein D9757_000466 [Collybiopsis confluens]|uniref:Mannosyltransferase n=1 Tax=Collybiopsis confluens TaxID=2823264 RepID=A0A8H5MGK3_9AGAR|nr:hypothetical protein D9757_000466 [Collybiopsis confluens]